LPQAFRERRFNRGLRLRLALDRAA